MISYAIQTSRFNGIELLKRFKRVAGSKLNEANCQSLQAVRDGFGVRNILQNLPLELREYFRHFTHQIITIGAAKFVHACAVPSFIFVVS